MLTSKKALILVGSPRVNKSTSESIGNYLSEGLINKGYECSSLHIISKLKNDVEGLLQQVNDADMLIITFPLYIDCLPSPLIKAMELINQNRKGKENSKKQCLIAIVNNGFPEASQNETSLKICEIFAKNSGFQWLGGIPLGGGGAINGNPITKGSMTKNIALALDMTIEAIVNDNSIPSEAIYTMSKGMVPKALYTFFGNQRWKSQAKKNNSIKNMYAKPYLK